MLFGEVLSCESSPSFRASAFVSIACTSRPSTSTEPSSGASCVANPFNRVLFPEPFGPTRAVTAPGSAAIDSPSMTGAGAFGYPNTRLSASRALASPAPTESTVSLASVVPLGTSESVAFACSVDIQSSPMFCCLRIRYRKYGPPTSPVTIPTGICESAPVITLIPSRAPTSAPTMSAGPTNRQPTITRL